MFSIASFAQKAFEGRIEFLVEYVDLPPGADGVEAMLPKRATWMVRNQQTRIVQHVPLAGWQVFLYLPELDSFYQQIELFDKNMLFAKPLVNEMNRFREIPKEDTKMLLGFELKQSLLQNANGDVLTIWYTPKFRNTSGTELHEIKGLPLDFEIMRNGIKYRLTATKITEEPVDDTYFQVPSDHVRIRIDDLHKILD